METYKSLIKGDLFDSTGHVDCFLVVMVVFGFYSVILTYVLCFFSSFIMLCVTPEGTLCYIHLQCSLNEADLLFN